MSTCESASCVASASDCSAMGVNKFQWSGRVRHWSRDGAGRPAYTTLRAAAVQLTSPGERHPASPLVQNLQYARIWSLPTPAWLPAQQATATARETQHRLKRVHTRRTCTQGGHTHKEVILMPAAVRSCSAPAKALWANVLLRYTDGVRASTRTH